MLKAKAQNQSEVFDDGILTILNAKDGVILSNKFSPIRYGVRTVGAIRFYQAEVAGTEIEMMISVPFNSYIKQKDLVEIHSFHTDEKLIYRIKQLQPKDTAPKSIYLTLEKTDVLFTDTRTD
jgi:hypothetical protein